jgi:hypothetical protein
MEQHNQFTEEKSSTRKSSSSSAEANDETITQAPADGSNNANNTQEASRCTETTGDSATEAIDEAQQLPTGTGRTRTRRTRRKETEADKAMEAKTRASRRTVASTSVSLEPDPELGYGTHMGDNVDRKAVTTEVSTDSQQPISEKKAESKAKKKTTDFALAPGIDLHDQEE